MCWWQSKVGKERGRQIFWPNCNVWRFSLRSKQSLNCWLWHHNWAKFKFEKTSYLGLSHSRTFVKRYLFVSISPCHRQKCISSLKHAYVIMSAVQCLENASSGNYSRHFKWLAIELQKVSAYHIETWMLSLWTVYTRLEIQDSLYNFGDTSELWSDINDTVSMIVITNIESESKSINGRVKICCKSWKRSWKKTCRWLIQSPRTQWDVSLECVFRLQ